MELLFVFFIWLFFGIVSSIIATSRGRAGCGWFVAGLLLGPLGLIVALLPKKERAGTTQKCPFCAEIIKAEAKVCRYCGRKLPDQFELPDKFASPNLEAAIRENLRKFGSPILKSDIAGLTQLNANRRNITDLHGIEHCINLQELYLVGNQIIDVSPLSGLTNLHSLLLNDNQISDISSLVSNSGIGGGDTVDLRGNPLNDEAYNVHIPALRKRGMMVLFDPKP